MVSKACAVVGCFASDCCCWRMGAAVLSVRLGEGELECVVGPVPSPLSVWLCVV